MSHSSDDTAGSGGFSQAQHTPRRGTPLRGVHRRISLASLTPQRVKQLSTAQLLNPVAPPAASSSSFPPYGSFAFQQQQQQQQQQSQQQQQQQQQTNYLSNQSGETEADSNASISNHFTAWRDDSLSYGFRTNPTNADDDDDDDSSSSSSDEMRLDPTPYRTQWSRIIRTPRAQHRPKYMLEHTSSGLSEDSNNPFATPTTPSMTKRGSGLLSQDGDTNMTDSGSSTPTHSDGDVQMKVGSLDERGSSFPNLAIKKLQKSKSLGSLGRIATLLEDETRPFMNEIAHERALNKGVLPLVDGTGGGGVGPSPLVDVPDSPVSAASTGEVRDELSLDSTPLPLRTVTIPNSHIKDPAVYMSNSSKLNPENNYAARYQDMITSPSLSPINTPSGILGSLSPLILGKGKRKYSDFTVSTEERFEPYKRPHRIPSSPSSTPMNASNFFASPMARMPTPEPQGQMFMSLRGGTPPLGAGPGAGGYFAAVGPSGTGPYGYGLPYPMNRQRSPSVSSTSSLTSMLGIERASSGMGNGSGSGNGSQGNGGGAGGSGNGGAVPMGWVPSSPRLISSGGNGGGVAPMMLGGGAGSYSSSGMFPPASPRGMPQMLNLSGAQDVFQKMKISKQVDGDAMKD
ncbi:hypothetical protein HDV00_005962 [Rhizophlyctis rosea]|nr:hypothetical protein HDV00_005962 [Rhizophlyctis rosea]